MFLRCRRRFNWEYVQNISARERLCGPLALGGRVHASIEAWFKTGESPIDVHQRLGEAAVLEVTADGSPGWVLDELYEDIVMGRNCCRAFLDWVSTEGPYDGYSAEPEVKLEAPILGGRAILIGKVDLKLTRLADGWISTDDVKTAGLQSRTNLAPSLERSYQHAVYQVLMRLCHPSVVIGEAWYTILYKSKNPKRATHPLVERFRVPGLISSLPTKQRQIETIVDEMLRFIGDVETQPERAYPTPADSCRWCEMRHPCSIIDESPAGAAAMLAEEFEHGARHARYAETDPDPGDD